MVSVTDGIKTKHLCVKLTFVPFARVEDSHFVSVKMHRMRHGTSWPVRFSTGEDNAEDIPILSTDSTGTQYTTVEVNRVVL